MSLNIEENKVLKRVFGYRGLKEKEAGEDYTITNALLICFTWHKETWILHF
jgi:hypothetical protein